ncbi:MAG TPA: GTPase Era [Pseudomonadales bacterium]
MNLKEPSEHYCGYVAIVGRPNVGKSTLLNYILGQKIAITSRKPQTTRHRMLGIKTTETAQVIYVDTPGIHGKTPRAINRHMNRTASSAIVDVDVVVFMIESTMWTDDDELVLDKLKQIKSPVFLVINKVDKLADKEQLLPFIEKIKSKMAFAEIFPVSALQKDNLDHLEQAIMKRLPAGERFFPEDQITDRSQRFLAAELVREKLMRQLGEEIPYELTVEIEEFKQEGKILHISALVLVERDSQKAIIIGNKGQRLKNIGKDARLDMETLFDTKVMLNLWVKVKSGWSDDERALQSLGYEDFK